MLSASYTEKNTIGGVGPQSRQVMKYEFWESRGPLTQIGVQLVDVVGSRGGLPAREGILILLLKGR